MTRYCLWDEPWIPVIDQAGRRFLISIRDGLVQADELQEIYDPSPLVTVAIHRLFMAVLYRIYNPRSESDWAKLWRKGKFDSEQLNEYGAKWADRFDLFHPIHPFYQVPYTENESVHPIRALILEAASGNNATLFDHGKAEGGNWLTPDRAACHLLAHQLFAVGGGISKPFNRMDGPLTKGLVVEARSRKNFFETLLLNLMSLDEWRTLVPETSKDVPFWEMQDPPEPIKNGTVPFGPIHYLTWQSRQIYLCVEKENCVTGCQIRQRYCLPKNAEKIDPGLAYRKDKKLGWVPFKVDKRRAAWHYTHVLLQTSEKEDKSCPHLIKWLAKVGKLADTKGLVIPSVIGLNVSGLTTDPQKAAKIELWRREVLPLPVEFLNDPDLVEDLKDLIAEAGRAEWLLQRCSETLVWALGERQNLDNALRYFWTGKKPEGKMSEQLKKLAQSLGMVTQYWPSLEPSFRQAMLELPHGNFEVVEKHWRTAVCRAASKAFQAARDSLLHVEASYEVLSQVDHAFYSRLASIFFKNADEDKGGDAGVTMPNE